MTERLLCAREVADQLGVTIETVLRWTRAGRLPGYRIGGRALRFRESELDAWIAGQATAAPGREDRQITPTGAAAGPYSLTSLMPDHPAADRGQDEGE